VRTGDLGPDQHVPRIAEHLDDALAEPGRGQARADRPDRHRLRQSELDQRPTGEVDVVPQPALDEDRPQAEEHDGD